MGSPPPLPKSLGASEGCSYIWTPRPPPPSQKYQRTSTPLMTNSIPSVNGTRGLFKAQSALKTYDEMISLLSEKGIPEDSPKGTETEIITM